MTLAINGGEPVRREPFPAYGVIGEGEKRAAMRVLDSQILSKYLGCWDEDFYGGPEIQSLEAEWREAFGVRHAIAVNSCTSGLYAAVGAIGVEPGDEIIVSPYTMAASSTAPLIYNAIPVFADIEPDTFCLDPKSVEERISDRTRAIIVVDIFGQPYDADRINEIARRHNLLVIEDCAQAPGAFLCDKYAGTLGDVGVYSLNYHKHIHCGEGGIVVTDDDTLAERIRLISNHGEAVVGEKGTDNIVNLMGFNFRLPELQAAIAREQLKRLPRLVAERQDNCAYLNERFSTLPGITPPKVRDGASHSYYIHALLFEREAVGAGRDAFLEALRAELPVTELRESEGPLIGGGYVRPLYLQPMFQKKIAYGLGGYPFSLSDVSYERGICPVTESLYERSLITHEMMRPGCSRSDLDDVVRAFEKVIEHRGELNDR